MKELSNGLYMYKPSTRKYTHSFVITKVIGGFRYSVQCYLEDIIYYENYMLPSNIVLAIDFLKEIDNVQNEIYNFIKNN